MTLPDALTSWPLLTTPVFAGLLAIGWLGLAFVAPRLADRRCRMLTWGLVLLGVPIVGWLTLTCGPVVGVAGLTAGAYLLIARPMAPQPAALPVWRTDRQRP